MALALGWAQCGDFNKYHRASDRNTRRIIFFEALWNLGRSLDGYYLVRCVSRSLIYIFV